MAGPESRAAWTQNLWNGVAELPSSTASEIRSGMQAHHLRELEKSLPIRWLPLAVHMDLLESAHNVLGTIQFQRFWRDRTMSSLGNPLLFGKAVKVALRNFGRGPLGILRAIPISIRYVIREAGELRVAFDDAQQTAVVTHNGFPSQHSEGLTWASSWLGAIQGVVMYATDAKASVTLKAHDPARGYFEFLVETLD